MAQKSYKSLHAKKSLGQNFLSDSFWIQRIVQAFALTPTDTVLEIGPGKGVLTRELLKYTNCLYAVEIDQRMVGHLQEEFPDAPNLNLVHADFLEYNLSQELAGKPVRILGNLPYHVTSGILLRVLEEVIRYHQDPSAAARITDFSIMIQLEVADRILASPGGREYGILTVYRDLLCTGERLLDVPPEAFYPRPKVMSAVMRLIPRDTPKARVDDWDCLRRLVRAAFNKRRKMMRNSLAGVPGLPSIEEIEQIAPEVLDLRPEQLLPQDFASIANRIHAFQREAGNVIT